MPIGWPGFIDCLRRNGLLHRRVAVALAGLTAALPIAGCGGTSKAGGGSSASSHASAPASTSTATSATTVAQPPSPCTPKAVAALARFLRVGDGAISTREIASNSAGAPQCNFTVHARRHKVLLWVSVDSSPQPYAVLERAAEEDAQNFANLPQSQFPVPQNITHVGLDAYWFPGPAAAHLLTTDAVRLITATILRWPGEPKKHWSVLAVAVARPYLGRSQPKLARGPAP